MDADVRRWRPLLIACAAAALVACGGAGGGRAVGVSERAPGGSASRDGGAGAGEAPALSGAELLPPGYRTAFAKVNRARLVSLGHAGGRWEVDVYANEAAAAALAARSRDVPVGAIVVEEHFERADGKPPGPVMMMEKREKGYAPRHGDWRFVVVGANGRGVKDGPVESCASCHDDAPMDGLFPIVE